MDTLETYQDNCRICLKQPALLNWNEEILDSCDMTYKFCYYKYTQLDALDPDPFTTMLCETCSCDLRSVHVLIEKALESNDILQQTLVSFGQTFDVEVKINVKDQLEEGREFETVFLEESKDSVTDDKDNKDLITLIDVETTSKEDIKKEENKRNRQRGKRIKLEEPKNISEDLKKRRVKKQIKVKETFPENLETLIDIPPSPTSSISSTHEKATNSERSKINGKITCAYCPKLFLPRNLKDHERTHDQQRERKYVCPKCGTKFFNNSALYCHKMIHEKDREKKYKCEFCEKSYYNSGALSLHRRGHLGQTISCPICSKVFLRQCDLNKHNARSHSSEPLSTNVKKNIYLVECKNCGKSIASHRWKHHQLLHSNDYKMKCTLCEKHFASKLSCHRHVRRFHKYMDDFAKVVEYYGDDINKRSSLLRLQQTEIVKPLIANF